MSTATAATPQKEVLFQTVSANEWGQITGLEPGASYFVIRRPTKALTQEKRQQFVSDVTAFLHQQKEITEKQMRELNDKYGAPAKAKALEVREQLERRFDELTREFEARVEKLEHELGERADRILQKTRPATGAPGNGSGHVAETPGEMPTGESVANAAPAAPETTEADAKGTKAKKGAKKQE